MRPALLTLTSKCLVLGCQLETTETIEAGKEMKLLREKEGLLMLGRIGGEGQFRLCLKV